MAIPVAKNMAINKNGWTTHQVLQPWKRIGQDVLRQINTTRRSIAEEPVLQEECCDIYDKSPAPAAPGTAAAATPPRVSVGGMALVEGRILRLHPRRCFSTLVICESDHLSLLASYLFFFLFIFLSLSLSPAPNAHSHCLPLLPHLPYPYPVLPIPPSTHLPLFSSPPLSTFLASRKRIP